MSTAMRPVWTDDRSPLAMQLAAMRAGELQRELAIEWAQEANE